jgi:hypothetical protein
MKRASLPVLLRCMSPDVALRVISRRRSNSVALAERSSGRSAIHNLECVDSDESVVMDSGLAADLWSARPGMTRSFQLLAQLAPRAAQRRGADAADHELDPTGDLLSGAVVADLAIRPQA